jgi:ankyrin repeat protein
MKHLLLTTIAAVVLVGCGPSAPDISIHEAAKDGNIEAWLLDNSVQAGNIQVVKHNIANGADVNAKDEDGETPLDWVIEKNHTEIADLLRKHGGKTGAELKAEGK